METPQGQVDNFVPAPLEGQVTPQPDGGVAVPQPIQEPAVVPAPPDGTAQGTPTQADATQPEHFQSLYNKTLAEKYALEQQMRQMQEFQMKQMQTAQPQQVQHNPFDPQIQPTQWWDWKMQDNNRRLVDEVDRRQEQRLNTMIQQANEVAWVNQHQNEMTRAGITVDHIKNFNRMKGIADWNLDVGWQLMNLPNTVANVARQTQQQTIQNIRQPQTGANPIRGTSPATQTPQFSYDADAKEFEKNGWNYPPHWTAERIQAFTQETEGRRYSTTARGDRTA